MAEKTVPSTINPVGIVIDRRGLVYVTDISNNHIQTYTFKGQFLSQFGTKGCPFVLI